MDASTIGLIAFAAVLILLALRVPIAFALASVATSSERAERWAPVFDTNSPVKNY